MMWRSKVIIRRRRRDICNSLELSQEIPFDLVIEILTRLPPKSLMRRRHIKSMEKDIEPMSTTFSFKTKINYQWAYMYYLAWESLYYPVLVSFNISSEEIRLLQKPEDVFWHGYYINLIEYAGKIAIFGHANLVKDGVMKLWVMEDEEKNIWSRKKLVLHPSQMNMVLNNNANSPYYLKVHDTTRNGEVILAPHNKFRRVIHGPIHVLPQGTTLFYVLLYNIQKNHLRRVEIEEGSNCFLNKRWAVIGLDDTENLMYL
ncbi:hypothetical protein DY000_02026924 [Brassica cretica]|uniref:F-box associated beta-propeller type 3 domain-containing protein n=1 Tax=Brassica cretica TaxID=69181 RepID=A0ABQ7E4R6_BRACR|nr:hypothetical protein DY000_02026924 [Brassica cretica]